MSSGEDSSHELALISVGPDAPGPEERRVGLNHFAWEMETFEELQELYLGLKQRDVKVSMVDDHGISLGVYFFDPDGIMIEAFNELPRDQWPTEGDLFGGTFPPTLWRSRRPPLHSHARRRSHKGSGNAEIGLTGRVMSTVRVGGDGGIGICA